MIHTYIAYIVIIDGNTKSGEMLWKLSQRCRGNAVASPSVWQYAWLTILILIPSCRFRNQQLHWTSITASWQTIKYLSDCVAEWCAGTYWAMPFGVLIIWFAWRWRIKVYQTKRQKICCNVRQRYADFGCYWGICWNLKVYSNRHG